MEGLFSQPLSTITCPFPATVTSEFVLRARYFKRIEAQYDVLTDVVISDER